MGLDYKTQTNQLQVSVDKGIDTSTEFGDTSVARESISYSGKSEKPSSSAMGDSVFSFMRVAALLAQTSQAERPGGVASILRYPSFFPL